MYKKVSGSVFMFFVLYVDDILLIGNNISVLQSVKIWLSKNFSIKIYRDRSKRLLGLSRSTYTYKMLKMNRTEQSKRGFIPMIHGITLSKSMGPRT